jgi:hypothetical protein
MRFVVYEQATGRIVQLVDCTSAQSVVALPGQAVMEADLGVRDDTHYIQAGKAKTRPARPSEHHEWKWDTKSWAPNLQSALAKRLADVEKERDRRIKAPIAFDDKVLDADDQAQKNITDKLTAIAKREARGKPPLSAPLLVWRDHLNANHSFPDQGAYRDWLSDLVIAIEERGTQAWIWSWQKKAEMQACATYEQLMAVSLSD